MIPAVYGAHGRESGRDPERQGAGHNGIVDSNCRDEIVGLYDAFFKEVFAYCTYRLYSKDLAEDAASTVFTRLVEKYPALRSRGKSRIRSWLYGTASNVVAKYLRDVDRHRRIVADLSRARGRWQDKVSDAGDPLDWPSVYEAIASLSDKNQAVIVMRYFLEFGSPTIAEALGMTQVAVRVRLSRAVGALRKRLGAAND